MFSRWGSVLVLSCFYRSVAMWWHKWMFQVQSKVLTAPRARTCFLYCGFIIKKEYSTATPPIYTVYLQHCRLIHISLSVYIVNLLHFSMGLLWFERLDIVIYYGREWQWDRHLKISYIGVSNKLWVLDAVQSLCKYIHIVRGNKDEANTQNQVRARIDRTMNSRFIQ